MDKFLTFLESLRTKDNVALIESIKSGYKLINENAAYNDGTGEWHSETQAKFKEKNEDGSYAYSDESLKSIIQECKDAVKSLPSDATNTEYGEYEDTIHYCADELRRRQRPEPDREDKLLNLDASYNDGTGKWHSQYQAKLKSKKSDGTYAYNNDSLKYIIQDCKNALDAMPDNSKAGQYADEIHYCVAELRRRQADQAKRM
jgi:hypothetical protein